MTLQEAIKSIPDWQNKTVQELHTLLHEVHVSPDPTPYTFVSLGEELTRRGYDGSSIRSLVNYTMMRVANGQLTLPQGMEPVAADIDSARIAMSATAQGLSLHTTERQQLVGLLSQIGQWPAGTMELVLSLGVKQTIIWDATEEQIQEALDAIAYEEHIELLQAKKSAQASALRYALSSLEYGDYTNDQLITLIQSNLPSE